MQVEFSQKFDTHFFKNLTVYYQIWTKTFLTIIENFLF